jgi:hypothetical protein
MRRQRFRHACVLSSGLQSIAFGNDRHTIRIPDVRNVCVYAATTKRIVFFQIILYELVVFQQQLVERC